MKQNENTNEQNQPVEITEKDFQEFLSATGEAQWRILLAHAEKNKKIIQIRRTKKMNEQLEGRRLALAGRSGKRAYKTVPY